REAITGDSELPNGTYFWRRLRDRTRIYYDEAGRQVLVHDRVAHTARYTYRDATPDAPLATIRIAPRDANLVYTFVYDSSGRLDKITDPAGRELDVTVDSSGRLTAFLDPGMEASQE